MALIYKVISPSGRIYIGKTAKSLEERKRRHICSAFNKNSNMYRTKFSRAIRKYKELLNWEILRNDLDISELNSLEIAFIKEFDSIKKGYNISNGGTGGNTIFGLSKSKKEAFKRKMSKIMYNHWRNVSEEKKESIVKNLSLGTYAAKNRIKSAEEDARRASSMKEFWDNNPEMKKIFSEKNKGDNNPTSLKNTMVKYDCTIDEAKKILSGRRKKGWETRKKYKKK